MSLDRPHWLSPPSDRTKEATLRINKVLAVDDSRIMREILSTLLAPYCPEVRTAGARHEALRMLEAHPDTELVLCDVVLPDGDGFDVLSHVASLPEPKPKVILVTARWSSEDAARAAALEAVGYLSKPISLKDIRESLEASPLGSRADVQVRRRTLAKVWLVDPAAQGTGLVSWDLHNISIDGAFLETKGPVPIGTSLHLEIPLGEDVVRARGVVVRLQEPSWMHVGGVGIRFEDLDEEARSTLRKLVEGNLAVWPDVELRQDGVTRRE